MTSLHIKIHDPKKTEIIIDLLRELPFVEIEEETNINPEEKSGYSLEGIFGIWEDRDITLDQIRKSAWNRGLS